MQKVSFLISRSRDEREQLPSAHACPSFFVGRRAKVADAAGGEVEQSLQNCRC